MEVSVHSTEKEILRHLNKIKKLWEEMITVSDCKAVLYRVISVDGLEGETILYRFEDGTKNVVKDLLVNQWLEPINLKNGEKLQLAFFI